MTHTLRHINIFMIVGLFAVIAAGCKSQKQEPVAESVPPMITADGMAAATIAANLEWTAVTIPTKLSISSPISASISGRTTLRRGEYINISLRMLGMEVGYLYVDSDSAFLVDKFHRNYITEDVASLTARYNITLENIQDLLLGRPFEPGGGSLSTATASRFDAQYQNYNSLPILLLEPCATSSKIKSVFISGISNQGVCEPMALAIESEENYGLVCHYTNSQATLCGITPRDIELTATTPSFSALAQIHWNLDDAKWNEKASNIKFRSPGASYKRLSLDEILKGLSNE